MDWSLKRPVRSANTLSTVVTTRQNSPDFKLQHALEGSLVAGPIKRHVRMDGSIAVAPGSARGLHSPGMPRMTQSSSDQRRPFLSAPSPQRYFAAGAIE